MWIWQKYTGLYLPDKHLLTDRKANQVVHVLFDTVTANQYTQPKLFAVFTQYTADQGAEGTFKLSETNYL